MSLQELPYPSSLPALAPSLIVPSLGDPEILARALQGPLGDARTPSLLDDIACGQGTVLQDRAQELRSFLSLGYGDARRRGKEIRFPKFRRDSKPFQRCLLPRADDAVLHRIEERPQVALDVRDRRALRVCLPRGKQHRAREPGERDRVRDPIQGLGAIPLAQVHHTEDGNPVACCQIR